MSKQRPLVVDTCVVLQWLRRTPVEGQEDKFKAAHALLCDRMAKRYRFCIATPALAEVLTGIPEEHRDAALDVLLRMFEVLSFTFECACEAASITTAELDARTLRETQGRQRTKVDAEILACAKVAGAEGVATFDKGMMSMAKRSKLKAANPIAFTPAQEHLELGPRRVASSFTGASDGVR